MDFKNKVVVVTGAGGGVGRELVLQLLKKGSSVAAVDINKTALEETKLSAGDLSDKVSIHIVDITDKNRVKNLPEEVIECHGKIDGVINNAGIIQPFKTFMDLSDGEVERVMNINFFGMSNMTRSFIPYLALSKEACLGNVSSMGGFLPVPGQSLYGASKAAVKIATEGLRMELKNTNIGVTLFIPGGIETDIMKNSGLKVDKSVEEQKKDTAIKLTQPSEAAAQIIKGLEKNKAKVLIGTDTKFMDFLYRLVPQKACNIIASVMSKNHGGILNTTEKLQEVIV